MPLCCTIYGLLLPDKGFFPFYISLELLHHIRMDIIAIYTFQGMHSLFTKHLQDEICFNIIKVQALISLWWENGLRSHVSASKQKPV